MRQTGVHGRWCTADYTRQSLDDDQRGSWRDNHVRKIVARAWLRPTRRSTPSPAVPDRHHNWAASGALGVELLDCFNDGGPMILQYGECLLKSRQVTLCRCWIMACSAHRLHLRHLLRDGRLGIGDMGIRFRQPLQFGFAVGIHLTAQAAVLPAVAGFLDGLSNGWL